MIKICRIPFEARLDFYEGRSDSKFTKLIQNHVANGCAVCASDLSWIANYIPAVETAIENNVQNVSDWARNRARNIFVTRAIQPISPTLSIANIKRAAAALLFDSRTAQRSPGTARDRGDESVHLVYRTEVADIDLWQEQSRTGSWYVTGQALSLSGEELPIPSSAILVPASLQVDTIHAIFDDSEFSFETLLPGDYTLHLKWDELEIQVDHLTVGESEIP